MATATAILDTLRTQLDTSEYKKLHWEGSFAEYLNTALESPGVTRTAYQRLYDRQRLTFEYTEKLEAIINATRITTPTQAPVNGTGQPDTSSGRTPSRDARGGV